MAAKALGVKKLIAIDISEEKLVVAKSLGATHVLNPRNSQFMRNIANLTDGGVDFCIESAGTVETIELGFSLTRFNGGKLYFASHPPDGEVIRLSPHDLIKGKQIIGSWGGGSAPDRDIEKISTKFHIAKINYNPLITKRYPLELINEALKDLKEGRVFRPLIEMSHE
jgi:S-(hydroxymethyl)glutathione dehydrogenase/alcohol dehydrogenase